MSRYQSKNSAGGGKQYVCTASNGNISCREVPAEPRAKFTQTKVEATYSSSSSSSEDCGQDETRDYVVIGAGTAGLTLAYLLNKDKKDVVVIEAGQNYNADPDIQNAKPIGGLEGSFLNHYFWTTGNQPNPALTNDTDRHMTGGRAVGGTSTVNDQIYWRGGLQEYAQWGGLFANSSYVQNTFARVETYSGTSQNPAARGTSGPFAVRQTDLVPVGQKMASALQATLADPMFGSHSVPIVPDFNTVAGPAISEQAQVWIKQTSPTTGQRQSTAIVLLDNKGSDVDVRDSATVLKIIFNKRGTRAIAVDYLRKGRVCRVAARKKIILCAGARSCAILMRSGYGPATLLNTHNIPVVYDNPEVGKNLRNHLFVTPQFSCPSGDNSAVARPTGTALNKDLAFMASVPAPSDAPGSQSLEYTVINAAVGTGVMAVILNAPVSSGKVEIFTNDPTHELIVTLPALSDPMDIQRMREAVKVFQNMINITPGYGFITSIPTTDSGIDAYVKANARSIHHYTGTCSIGKVVDSHMNVYGVDGLMVSDASIQSPSIHGHTYASAVLIGCAAYSEITGNLNVNF